MIDVTQTMACIQCGACVSDCLSMEVDPLFIGPAALAKAYRFVGDPRDAQHERAPAGPLRGPARHLRLHPLLQLHRGLPEGRRPDEPDHAAAPHRRQRLGIDDRNNGHRHEHAFVGQHRAGTASCTRPSCCPAPTAAMFQSRAPVPELVELAARRSSTRCSAGKVTPGKALFALAEARPRASVQAIFRKVDDADGALRAEPLRRWAKRSEPESEERSPTP